MEAVTEKPSCAKCDAEVREGTAYCYACGAPVGDTPVRIEVESDPTGTNGASADAISETPEDPLTKAREERRRARVNQRKPLEYSWDPTEDSRLALLAAILITAAVGAVVAAMVLWK